MGQLISQEIKNWTERNVGLNLFEMMQTLSLGRPASPKYIAELRFEQEENQKVVDTAMASKEIQCTICMSNLEEGEAFMTSPCYGGHQFHTECFLEQLRNKNICPNCRYEFPKADPPPWEENATRVLYFRALGFGQEN